MKSHNKLTLKDIAKFYEEYFVGKTKIFKVKHKNTPFTLKFEKGHLHHLIAIHKFGLSRGEKLFYELLNENITLETLKKRDEGAFKEFIYRIQYFIYLEEMLLNPNIMLFDRTRANSRINADLMFYHYNDNCKRFLFLGVRKESANSNDYIPVTFLEAKKNRWEKVFAHIPLQVKEAQPN